MTLEPDDKELDDMRKAVDREEDQCDDASIRQAIFGASLGIHRQVF